MDETLRLSRLESVVETPMGEHLGAPALPHCDPGVGALEALESAIMPALLRPPCLVEFSGGRDSSVLLAAACGLARREGLSLPIPATNVYPGEPRVEESCWQELVIKHLGLTDWHRRTVMGDFDLIGPLAQSVLRRHGLVAPSAMFSIIPSFRDAAGGASVSGIDGDGILRGWSWWRPWAVLRRRVPPEPLDALRIAKLTAPGPLRRWWVRRRSPLDVTYLLPEAEAAIEGAWRAWWASEPVVWDKRVAWWARSRLVTVVEQAMRLMATDFNVLVSLPFLNPAFLAALAKEGGRSGFGDRTANMKALFGGLLPIEVLARSSKANFTPIYWTEHSKEFAAQWTGEGVPLDLVDPDALREIWAQELPDARSGLLLQAAWLATSGARDFKQHFNSDLE